MKEKVEKVIEEIRPYIMNDGGNITLVKIENNIVYISLEGACANCPMRRLTFEEGIAQAIKNSVKEVKDVKLVND